MHVLYKIKTNVYAQSQIQSYGSQNVIEEAV